jgi:broad specificity phosphatase PhoE
MPPSPAQDSCVAFLIRHGATDNNVAHPPLLQGCATDCELSAVGREQAARAAQFLAPCPLAAVYSSPLLRAVQTAEQIAHLQQLAVQPVPALREVDVGNWEGRSWEEIARTEPATYRQFLDDAERFGYPGGENMLEVLARIAPQMEQLMRGHLGQRIVIVGHNVTHRVFVAHVLGVPLRLARRVTHHNCGVSIVEYRAGHTRLVTLNTNFHLGELLVQ